MISLGRLAIGEPLLPFRTYSIDLVLIPVRYSWNVKRSSMKGIISDSHFSILVLVLFDQTENSLHQHTSLYHLLLILFVEVNLELLNCFPRMSPEGTFNVV